MKEINVFIEINGKRKLVGFITYNSSDDAFFTYDEEYSKTNKSISISLPTTKKSFSPSETKNYFDGLLPEGYVRNAIAESIHVDVNDYISLLLLLGKECIGALQILPKGYEENNFGYKKITKEEIKELANVNSDKSIDIIKNTHLSLAGATKKIGLFFDEKTKKLLNILLFDYLIGNADNHLKNISMVYDKNMQSMRLSPIYDIVSTFIYESTSKNFAMNINGKIGINDISLDDFRTLPFGSKMINDSIDNIVLNFPIALKKACNDLVEDGYTETEKICKMIMQLLDNKILNKKGYL